MTEPQNQKLTMCTAEAHSLLIPIHWTNILIPDLYKWSIVFGGAQHWSSIAVLL